jgi:hypothetical protein
MVKLRSVLERIFPHPSQAFMVILFFKKIMPLGGGARHAVPLAVA